MYEVQNRSIYEHDRYSFQVSRRNLGDLYKANLAFVHEMAKQNQLETRADYGNLKDQVFQKKTLGQRRLRGLGWLSLASYGYWNLIPLSLTFG